MEPIDDKYEVFKEWLDNQGRYIQKFDIEEIKSRYEGLIKEIDDYWTDTKKIDNKPVLDLSLKSMIWHLNLITSAATPYFDKDDYYFFLMEDILGKEYAFLFALNNGRRFSKPKMEWTVEQKAIMTMNFTADISYTPDEFVDNFGKERLKAVFLIMDESSRKYFMHVFNLK